MPIVPAPVPLDHESALRRLGRDLGPSMKGVPFIIGGVVATAMVTVATFGLINDDGNSDTARAAIAGLTVILGLVLAVIVLLVVLAVITPLRQRNESRWQRDEIDRRWREEIERLKAGDTADAADPTFVPRRIR